MHRIVLRVQKEMVLLGVMAIANGGGGPTVASENKVRERWL